MTSAQRGRNTSAEVLDISPHGVWVFAFDQELFLPFDQFPWFKGAVLQDVFELEEYGVNALYWPRLDVDLTVDMIEQSENYPLVAKS